MVMNIFLKYYISFVIFWTVFCAYTSHKQLSRQQSEGQIGRTLRAAVRTGQSSNSQFFNLADAWRRWLMTPTLNWSVGGAEYRKQLCFSPARLLPA